MRSVIVKSKFVLKTRHAKRRLNIWLDYCSRDKQRENDRLNPTEQNLPLRDKDFFSKDRNHFTKDEAAELIQSNFGKTVAYHQIILSSGDRHIDPTEFARVQMQVLEEKLGHPLVWVANIHRDTGPDKVHVNVTIAGAIPGFIEREPARKLEVHQTPDQTIRAGNREDEAVREKAEAHELNEIDRLAEEVTGGKYISPEGVKYRSESERAAKQVEQRHKQNRIAASWNERGDVYITRDALDAMRSRGNYYVHCNRNFDREIDAAIARELGERERSMERTRELDQARDEVQGDAVSNQIGNGDHIDRSDGSTDPAHEEEKRRREEDDQWFRRR